MRGQLQREISNFPVRTAHSQEFVGVFCFVSCNISQNFKNNVNGHYGCEAVEPLCFVLSHITASSSVHVHNEHRFSFKQIRPY